jgi:recombination protein RecA
MFDRAREIKEEIEKPISKKPVSKLVSTGSTLLNLAASDTPDGGFAVGTLVNIIGDSSAGKSMLLWTLFAEATYSKDFDDYDIIYDDAEHALEFDIHKLFGDKTEERVIRDIRSNTIEDFHDNIIPALGTPKKEKKVIYGLDSFDALTSEDEMERDIRKGSYKTEKPKMASEILRKIVGKIDNTDSLVVIVSQTRDNIGVTFGDKKTRSGGRALKFYSFHELWLAIESHIKRSGREVGVNVIAKFKKNRITGKQRAVKFPIYFDYGIDNIGSCIDWLIEEKIWTKTNGIIDTKGFITEKMRENDLANKLDSMQSHLNNLVAKNWWKIEKSIATEREPKYGR